MFPIFLWVDEYKGFKDFSINFDSRYKCSIDVRRDREVKVAKEEKKEENIIFTTINHFYEKSITIEKLEIREIKDKENNIKNFYGKNIEGINILAGKNGTGKTSILELLTFEEKHKINYILICKYKDKFYVEGNLPGINPEETLVFLNGINKENKTLGDMRNPFSFFMTIDNLYLGFAQDLKNENEKTVTEKAVVGRFKYNYRIEEIEKIRRCSENIYRGIAEVKKYSYSYEEKQYRHIYEFLNDVYSKENLKNNYKNAKLQLELSKIEDIWGLYGNYGNDIRGDIERIGQKIIDKFSIFKKMSNSYQKIIEQYCNYLYLGILTDQLNKEYREVIDKEDKLFEYLEILDEKNNNIYKKNEGSLEDYLKKLNLYFEESMKVKVHNYYTSL